MSQEENSNNLNQIIVALEKYLYNFYIKKIKPLSDQGIPIEFFKQKYNKELEIGIRTYLEQIYILRIDELARLYNTNRNKFAAVLPSDNNDNPIFDFFISITDIENIKNAVNDLKNRFFDGVNRLINRENTEEFSNEGNKLETITPFDAAAAIKRLALWGGYLTYNEGLLSKLTQTIGVENTRVMFLTKEDIRVDMDCIPFNRQIFRLTDSFLPRPPLHFNCRCVLKPVVDKRRFR